ncbi:MAG: hypothetical protein GY927_19215 [bacterium]|nr:hypothetical protein [bacterium]
MFSTIPKFLLATLSAGLLLFSTLAAQVLDKNVGSYCLTGVREVGSCIQLIGDGRFKYFLAYGAYDEESEGEWRAGGAEIILKSKAYAQKPQFRFKERRAAKGDTYEIIVVNKVGGGIAGIDVRANCGTKTSEGYTQYYGFATSCTNSLQKIELGVAMVGLGYQPLKLPKSSGDGKAYVFEFDPGDLGKKTFDGVRLQREGRDVLVLKYRDTLVKDLEGKLFRYQRQ